MLLVESRRVFARRRFHRAKAHLVLSALRHRAAELADPAEHLQVIRYADALGGHRPEVCHPTSYRALLFVQSLPRIARQLGTLDRLADLDELRETEGRRGTSPP